MATIDISKIPSTCTFVLSSGAPYGFLCTLRETIRGKALEAYAYGETPQQAVDEAVRKFLS